MLNSLKLANINPGTVNLTGIRLLVLFALLLDSPKTAEEINNHFKNNYPKEIFSIDTLRNDINALRSAGCDITRADKSNNFKYTLLSHPFELYIDRKTAKGFSRIYNRSYKFLTIEQLVGLENLFNTLANYTADEKVSEYLRGLSLLKKIDKIILRDLIYAYKNKYPVEFDYRVPNKSISHFEATIRSFEIRSRKLYINVYCRTYERNSYFPVHNIIGPITINISEESKNKNSVWVHYELKGIAAKNFVEQENEIILEQKENSIVVKYTTDTCFKITQQVLSYGPNCTIVAPDFMIDFNVKKLKEMYKEYEND